MTRFILRLCCLYILNFPDVRALINNDILLKEGACGLVIIICSVKCLQFNIKFTNFVNLFLQSMCCL